MNFKSKILITGANGMLGSALVLYLQANAYKNILTPSSKELDLLNLDRLKKFFSKYKPIYVFHLASKVYGIGGNSVSKFDMLNDNIIINSNLLKVCCEYYIRKIVCVGSAAIYTGSLKYNIKENKCFYKNPHLSEYDYGLSKRILLKQLQTLYKKNNINYSYAIMNNLYGLNDNFNVNKGHVVPSIIHKTFLAKKNNKDLKLWGTGDEKRCLMYSLDAARALEKIMQSKEKVLNVSSNIEYKIKDLSNLIKKEFNFNNKTLWINEFETVQRRHLNTDILHGKLKFNEEYSLEKSIKVIITWFLKNYNKLRK